MVEYVIVRHRLLRDPQNQEEEGSYDIWNDNQD